MRLLPALLSYVSGVALLGALGFAAFAAQPLEAMTVVLICFAAAMQLGFLVATIRAIRQGKCKPPRSVAEPLGDRP